MKKLSYEKIIANMNQYGFIVDYEDSSRSWAAYRGQGFNDKKMKYYFFRDKEKNAWRQYIHVFQDKTHGCGDTDEDGGCFPPWKNNIDIKNGELPENILDIPNIPIFIGNKYYKHWAGCGDSGKYAGVSINNRIRNIPFDIIQNLVDFEPAGIYSAFFTFEDLFLCSEKAKNVVYAEVRKRKELYSTIFRKNGIYVGKKQIEYSEKLYFFEVYPIIPKRYCIRSCTQIENFLRTPIEDIRLYHPSTIDGRFVYDISEEYLILLCLRQLFLRELFHQ